jgi:hypothetical protein
MQAAGRVAGGHGRFPDRCSSSRRDSTAAWSRRISSDGTAWLKMAHNDAATPLGRYGKLCALLREGRLYLCECAWRLRIRASVSGRGRWWWRWRGRQGGGGLVVCAALGPEKRGRSAATWRAAGEAEVDRSDAWSTCSASLVPGQTGPKHARATIESVQRAGWYPYPHRPSR